MSDAASSSVKSSMAQTEKSANNGAGNMRYPAERVHEKCRPPRGWEAGDGLPGDDKNKNLVGKKNMEKNVEKNKNKKRAQSLLPGEVVGGFRYVVFHPEAGQRMSDGTGRVIPNTPYLVDDLADKRLQQRKREENARKMEKLQSDLGDLEAAKLAAASGDDDGGLEEGGASSGSEKNRSGFTTESEWSSQNVGGVGGRKNGGVGGGTTAHRPAFDSSCFFRLEQPSESPLRQTPPSQDGKPTHMPGPAESVSRAATTNTDGCGGGGGTFRNKPQHSGGFFPSTATSMTTMDSRCATTLTMTNCSSRTRASSQLGRSNTTMSTSFLRNCSTMTSFRDRRHQAVASVKRTALRNTLLPCIQRDQWGGGCPLGQDAAGGGAQQLQATDDASNAPPCSSGSEHDGPAARAAVQKTSSTNAKPTTVQTQKRADIGAGGRPRKPISQQKLLKKHLQDSAHLCLCPGPLTESLTQKGPAVGAPWLLRDRRTQELAAQGTALEAAKTYYTNFAAAAPGQGLQLSPDPVPVGEDAGELQDPSWRGRSGFMSPTY